MNELVILFFGFIIAASFIGMWAGTKITEPKSILKQTKGGGEQNTLRTKMGFRTEIKEVG